MNKVRNKIINQSLVSSFMKETSKPPFLSISPPKMMIKLHFRSHCRLPSQLFHTTCPIELIACVIMVDTAHEVLFRILAVFQVQLHPGEFHCLWLFLFLAFVLRTCDVLFMHLYVGAYGG